MECKAFWQDTDFIILKPSRDFRIRGSTMNQLMHSINDNHFDGDGIVNLYQFNEWIIVNNDEMDIEGFKTDKDFIETLHEEYCMDDTYITNIMKNEKDFGKFLDRYASDWAKAVMLDNKKQEAKASKEKSELMSKLNRQIDVNKEALKMAAKLEVGGIVLNKAHDLVAAKAPMMVNGAMSKYPELSDVVIANLINLILTTYAGDNDKAQLVASAVMVTSMQKLIKSFNIEELIDKLIKDVPANLMKKVEKEEKETSE